MPDAATNSFPLASGEAAMMRAVIDSIARPLEGAATLCIQLMGGPSGPSEPDESLLRGLTTPHQVETMKACPPTYSRMFARVDSVGRSVDPARPAGYIDPVRLTIGRPQFERVGYAWVYVRQRQGTSGRDYICVAQSSGERITAGCHLIREWIH